MSALDFDHDEIDTGGTKRPTKVVLKGLHPEHGQVGHLTYHVPRRKADKIYVDRLEIDPEHQGNGYASQLMDEMQRRHPGTPIDHGDRTPDGKGWWAGYIKDKRVTKGRTMASKTAVSVSWEHHDDDSSTWSEDYHSWAKEKPHAVAVSQAQEHVRRHVPTMGMDLGSGEDATNAMQHMLRKGGHPDHDEGFVMKHPNLGWGQSQAFTSDGQPGVSLHPSKWDYGTLAHETAHHLHQHELGRKPHDDAEAHGPDFIRHYQSLLGDFGRGASDKLGEKYHESLGKIRGHTASRVASGHPFIHVSPREFKPGDKIEPADDHGGQSTFDYSDLDKVYLSHPDHAEYWGNTVGAAGGHKEVHHYEVEPHEHPEFQISSDNEEEYTSSGATVKRKVRTQKVDPRAYTREQIHPSLRTPEGREDSYMRAHDREENQYAQRVPSWERKGAKEPNQRLFGPTFGLDHRLFEGEHLKDDVRRYILETLGEFWKGLHGYSWDEWAKVYFAGSEASEWTSESLEGNGDFDVLIGVDYDKFRANACRCHPAGSDEEITAQLNEELRRLDAKTENAMIMVDGEMTGPWNQTWYVNKDSLDIRKIKPYAAYDVTDDVWAVRPPHLPDWDISQFPQGHALVQEAHAVAAYVRSVLAMPEPFRSQQATALWEHLHGDRGRAFGPQGEGWYDSGNVLEKFLDQLGLWQKLVDARVQARDHPEMLNAPRGWSNDPHGRR